MICDHTRKGIVRLAEAIQCLLTNRRRQIDGWIMCAQLVPLSDIALYRSVGGLYNNVNRVVLLVPAFVEGSPTRACTKPVPIWGVSNRHIRDLKCQGPRRDTYNPKEAYWGYRQGDYDPYVIIGRWGPAPRPMKKKPPLSWSILSAEFRRREVYPVVVAYALVGWILLQIGEVTLEPLGFPGWVMTGLIALVIVGFPVTLILAWNYDLTSRGIRRDTGITANADDVPSIAVLPFVDMSPEQNQAYFCEGVAEEILNALTNIHQLEVAARSSSFQFKSEAGDVREIGRRLGVKTILEGSVRKWDQKLRVTAQLVKVSDGYHIWSKTFDQELADVFAIQDEIASSIAESLLESITPNEHWAIRTTYSANINAYDCYLRGRQYFKRFRKSDMEHARHMFQQAINLDPEFALAWAGYADSHSFLMMYADPNPAYAEQADQASKRALELKPNLAEAHASRGLAYLVCRKFEQAEAEFNKALELNPALFDAYYYYGRSLVRSDRLPVASAARADSARHRSCGNGEGGGGGCDRRRREAPRVDSGRCACFSSGRGFFDRSRSGRKGQTLDAARAGTGSGRPHRALQCCL